MATLGVEHYELQPEGAKEDKINFDTFLTQA